MTDQDLTAKEPAQIEADSAVTVTVEDRGETYVLPAATDDWPARVTHFAEGGKPIHAMETLLGDQAERWWSTDPTNATADAFFRRYLTHIGIDLPG